MYSLHQVIFKDRARIRTRGQKAKLLYLLGFISHCPKTPRSSLMRCTRYKVKSHSHLVCLNLARHTLRKKGAGNRNSISGKIAHERKVKSSLYHPDCETFIEEIAGDRKRKCNRLNETLNDMNWESQNVEQEIRTHNLPVRRLLASIMTGLLRLKGMRFYILMDCVNDRCGTTHRRRCSQAQYRVV